MVLKRFLTAALCMLSLGAWLASPAAAGSQQQPQRPRSEAEIKQAIDQFLARQKWPDAYTIKPDKAVGKYAGRWTMRMTAAQRKQFAKVKTPSRSTILLRRDGTFSMWTTVANEKARGVAMLRGNRLFLAKRFDDSEFIRKGLVESPKQEMRIPLVFQVLSPKKMIYKNSGETWEFYR